MKKTKVLVFGLLACAASVQAAEWYEIPGGDTWSGGANWTGYNYNATPDPTAVADWEATYVAPYTTWKPTPYFVAEPAVSAVPTDGTANLRQNMITARADLGAGDVVKANILEVADSYWPLNYPSFGTTFTSQEIRQNGAGSSVTVNTLRIGHDRGNEFAIPNGVVIGNQGKYNLRAGSLKITDVRMINESKIVTPAYGMNFYSITSEASAANNAGNVKVDIGDIYLNETMLHTHMNAGKWTITGDLKLENGTEGNACFMLFGTRTAERSTVLGNAAELIINWTTLEDMIGEGMLWSKTGTSTTAFRPGTSFSFGGAGPYADLSTITDAHLITLANMYNELNIVDLGGGMASVVVSIVPEPATVSLLGLGLGSLILRRRRA